MYTVVYRASTAHPHVYWLVKFTSNHLVADDTPYSAVFTAMWGTEITRWGDD